MSDLVLPFYMVCDQSFTMLDHLADLDQGLREMLYTVATDPVALSKIRLGVIGFSAAAQVLLPLTKLDVELPCRRMRPSAASRYGAAFRLLRTAVEQDIQSLRKEWHQVSRPAVYFLASGQPTDPIWWPAAHALLTDLSWPSRPQIVAFGLGDVDATTMADIGTARAFLGEPGTSPTAAVHGFVEALTRSILDSGAAAAEHGHGVLDAPDRIAGYAAVGRPTADTGHEVNALDVHGPLAT